MTCGAPFPHPLDPTARQRPVQLGQQQHLLERLGGPAPAAHVHVPEQQPRHLRLRQSQGPTRRPGGERARCLFPPPLLFDLWRAIGISSLLQGWFAARTTGCK
uniref:Uncharacterized protein n=1 Tax=Heterosigma akashiwo TaxID=2829 RepID=A0A7S3UPQ2_HETAK